MKTFFGGGSLEFGQNKRLNFGENLFFYGDHLNLDKVSVSISVKTFFLDYRDEFKNIILESGLRMRYFAIFFH